MEIIFDSIEERDEFFKNSDCCPSDFGAYVECDGRDCVNCWLHSGVKWSIKVPDKTPKTLYISTADFHPNSLSGVMLRRMLNTYYGKEGRYGVGGYVYFEPKFELDEPEKDFLVMPRHAGRTAAMKMIDEMHTPYSKLDKLDHDYYHSESWKEVIDIFMDKHDRIKKPQIERVIFNNPATIVFWKDGTKTVVKCRDNDSFDPEKGLAMAICKKVLADKDGYYWRENFEKWLPKQKTLGELMLNALVEAFKIPVHVVDDIKPLRYPYTSVTFGQKLINPNAVVKIKTTASEEPTKSCEECKYEDAHEFDEPCRSCDFDCSNFEEKKEEQPHCENCKHKHTKVDDEPCCNCDKYSKFEVKEKEVKRSCNNCKYVRFKRTEYPCNTCIPTHINFKPKDAK